MMRPCTDTGTGPNLDEMRGADNLLQIYQSFPKCREAARGIGLLSI